MATKAEQAHADAERKGPKAETQKKLAQQKSQVERHRHHEPLRPEEAGSYVHPAWTIGDRGRSPVKAGP